MSSSTTPPPAARSARYQSGSDAIASRSAVGQGLAVGVTERNDRVAVAGTTVVVLDNDARTPGSSGANVLDRGEDIVDVGTSSHPTGTGTPTAAKSRRPALLNASGRSSGAVPLIGTSRATATATSSFGDVPRFDQRFPPADEITQHRR